ncbi:DUF4271 domain-containing protein [Flavobacterium columnare NBRC 100251 = ATCC 23463]|uniref:DUF4271 domain-containing protein n=1 Tax=Flavobacterium columnare (strain ATCC 49512 / CIP 103533 / TG 44/87) TaxID=1041826 RepID=G8XBS3_FLACA|nr:DUF4271 domain-containing protein [Flavobacterium columnare]AEW87488.1 hypothetical protein FCOL_13465 [Flavobacterium columnare ATCC 49512]ANO49437.1 hypothetical protein Pf1_01192 [Flavobacterium columnare]APT22601.1 DUF4271 domain-containing protein [Flavobacterium columnare]MBF6655427.1 DUF4271 domain-containing protein [Flavobacterium columnare]MBF6658280.1 DUF4271 domain-containing protein [Flavobacterium columnare]
MNNYELIPRIVESKNWITIVFIATIGVVTITKAVFEKRFTDFVKLVYNNKYIKIYKDPSNLMTWFTILLFFVQLISFSFFIQLVLSYYGYTTKTNWISFIQIITFLTFFVLSKYLIEKIIATSFDTELFVEQFNLFKVSYRTYLGILLLPVDMVLYYTNLMNHYVILGVLVIILIINAVTYLVSLRNYQNLLLRKLFYFILYICALEIAPYFFMYYYITNR